MYLFIIIIFKVSHKLAERFPLCLTTQKDVLTPPSTFLHYLCNTRGLTANFQSVKHHLFYTEPHLVFLTETQVSEATNSSPFSVPFYFIFVPNLDVAFMCAKTWLALVPTLKSHSLTKFIYAVYLSSNSSNYKKFFDYLISKVEHILFLSLVRKMLSSSEEVKQNCTISFYRILLNRIAVLCITVSFGSRVFMGECDISRVPCYSVCYELRNLT